MTAAVASLHLKYPGEYQVSVETTCPEIWQQNPGITPGLEAYQCHIQHLEYPLIHQAGSRHVHFMQGFCDDLGKKIKRDVPLLVNKPSLHLDQDESTNRLKGTEEIGPYIVLNAGHKLDFTAKFAGSGTWQRVVDHFKGRVKFVQVGEASPHHPHRPIENAINLVGKTGYRDLFRLCKHSLMGCGPVSFLLHVYGALGIPYVALAGGREDQNWEAYNTTQYLHTIGQLDCCRTKACWKSRTVPLNDGCHNDRSLCQLPVIQDGENVPKCMAMVGSDGVIRAIEQLLGGQ